MKTTIRRILEQKHWSLYQLALELDVSESTLYKYKNGYYISDLMKSKIEQGLDYLDKLIKIH